MYYQCMSRHYEVDLGVVRKVASTPAAAARLRHELRVLEHLDDLYTVTLVAADSSGEHPWIETRRVDGETASLALTCGRLDAKSLHRVASALCWLHGQGFAHGSFSGEHVILGRSGRATLCSLGRATHPAGLDDIRADNAAFGALIIEAGQRSANDRLARIGSQLASGTRDLWETSLALELLAAQPSPPQHAAGQGPPRDRRRRLAGIALATTAAVLLPMGLLAIREGEPTSASCPASDGPTVAIAGSECPAALSIDREGRVHVGNRVYALNLQRSTVRITDRNCDGSAELEVADEHSPLTAVFAEWPATDQPVSASLRAEPIRQDTTCDSNDE